MTIYAYFNQKGGVGKTTLAVHHAAHLYRSGSHPLLLDTDRQRHSSGWLNASGLAVDTKYVSPKDLADRILRTARTQGRHVLSDEIDSHGDIIIDAPGELDVA
ncbi:MAG: AAA family ATPase, partial [Planctomycetes bacterium]|nr:AAA family ATPase [Planctomycetota bacterium]